jgi:(2Fe-2S) ferredoxin
MAKKKGKKSGKNGALAAATRPDVKVRDHDAHVLVCKGGDCKKRGSKDVQRALKDELRAAGMNRDVRMDSVGCLGLCKHGPNAIVYPSGTWYLGLIEADAPEIVESHLKNGEPVEHLAAELRPRKK